VLQVQHIQWHPTAENVLASAGADNALIVWDVESGDMLMRCDVHPDMIFSISWSYNGSLIATSCKDKKIRMIDPRTGDTVQVRVCPAFC
jgi:WD40 repeat protein